MPFILVFVTLGLCIACFVLADNLFDADHGAIGFIAMVVAFVLAIVGVLSTLNAVGYGLYLANPDSHRAKAAEERETYTIMLDRMNHLAGQDVTASDTYLEVYENVMKFNSYVRQAQKWVGTWGEGIFGDPSYAGLEVIPIKGLD